MRCSRSLLSEGFYEDDDFYDPSWLSFVILLISYLFIKYSFSLFKYLIYLVNTFYIDITGLITTVYFRIYYPPTSGPEGNLDLVDSLDLEASRADTEADP